LPLFLSPLEFKCFPCLVYKSLSFGTSYHFYIIEAPQFVLKIVVEDPYFFVNT